MKKIVENVERLPKPDCNSCDLDFKITGPSIYIHLDIKHSVGSSILKKQKSAKSLQEMASDIDRNKAREAQNSICWGTSRSK